MTPIESHCLIGISGTIRDLRDQIDAAARSDAKVLIAGESGSGKEIAAHLIHTRSARSRGPLVTINCAGFPDTLLESELFGHARGSFTGADRDRPGVLEAANRGTLFMDEVGEMSRRMQAILLRFLESGEIERMGSDRPVTHVDVRLVAATNRDLGEAVKTSQFREDLHFRLNVIPIHVPPLRHRREDIPGLCEWFGRAFSQRYGVQMLQIAPDAMDLLVAYDWPGNVRELKNVMERLVVIGETSVVTARDLPAEIRRPEDSIPVPQVVPSPVEEMFDRIVSGEESFWQAVYEPFMARDLTRDELRALIKRGFEHTHGDHAALGRCFNVAGNDHKRFLNFVRKHGCPMPFSRISGTAQAG